LTMRDLPDEPASRMDYRRHRRSCQQRIDIPSQPTVAAINTGAAGMRCKSQVVRAANTSNPMLPKVAPRASIATAFAARREPSKPARCLFSFTCFSTRVAVEGKMAGNARKSPPTTGPKCLAINPVSTVATPPKSTRKTSSYHLVCRSAANWNLTVIYLRRTNHNPKAARSHDERRPAETNEADLLYLAMMNITRYV
jgi:hypothetical protein